MSVKRVGMVIGLRAEKADAYRELHGDDNPGVRDLLTKYHMHNFSIFARKLDGGQEVLFGYFEYTGDDYAADMAALDAEPRNAAWLELCDPCQKPLEGETSWAVMERVYFNA
ncbi:L-rhamnose mutarotase [bacterium]|nr:L-rhamnose mutarotase [bacterium]